MPLKQKILMPVNVSRLAFYGHSFLAPTNAPYGFEGVPWVAGGANGSVEGARYPDLLAAALGVDTSTRFLKFQWPASGTAGASSNTVITVPDEGALEALHLNPNASLTGVGTNTRAYNLFFSRNSALLSVAYRSLTVGNNTVAFQDLPIMDYSSAWSDTTLAYQDNTGTMRVLPVQMSGTQPLATGIGMGQSCFVFQSAAVGTGLADNGGEGVIRWGGKLRNFAVGSSRLVRCGNYHGGWAAPLMGRPPRHTLGPEVNATPGESAGATSLRCDALEQPVPSGWKIEMSGGVIATTTAIANVGATTISVSALSGGVALGEQGHARHPNAIGYPTLTPLATTVLGWGRNDAVFSASPERTGYKEALRFVASLASSPYLQPADRANVQVAAGNGTGAAWTAMTSYAGGPFLIPWTSQFRAPWRFRGAVGGTPPTITIKVGPAFSGQPIDLFFAGVAGTNHGAQATITASSSFNGGTACTISTTNLCTADNLYNPTSMTGTISGTTSLALTGTPTFEANFEQVGWAIRGHGNPGGALATGARIASVVDATHCTLDLASTNGNVIIDEIAGYSPMVKRLVGLSAGAKTITITLTGIDSAFSDAEFIFLGYGIESTPETPVVVVGAAKAPSDSGDWTDIDNVNTDARAVIAGTATNPNAGNSTEPALQSSVRWVDIDTPMGSGIVTANWGPDGYHPSNKGYLIHADTLAAAIRRNYTTDQLIAK